MQSLPPLVPGQLVHARAHRWTVERVTHAPPWAAVDLAGAEPLVAGHRLTLVTPADDIRLVERSPRPRRGGTNALLRALAAHAADAVAWPAPPCARDARIDLLPYQLSATLLLRAGRARRVLVADAVGSGKTIQAGIAIAQALEDTPGARVLVIVPASLKAQWRAELGHRFGLAPRLVESAPTAVAGEADASPWSAGGVTLASLDFVKRADVLGGLDAAWWHLLVVDEAHHAAGPSDRADAVCALATRARHVLLLTGTPHDGDSQRFARLCALGAHGPGDRLVVLARQPRGDAARRRRVHRRPVRPSGEEAHALHLLERYLDDLGARPGRAQECGPLALLATVLRKRATSSPAALLRSVQRRLALLGDADAALRQPTLDFGTPPSAARDEEEAEDPVLGARCAGDPRRERAWLGAIAEAARRAARTARVLSVLRALLRRIRQPAVVFTEYRATLGWLHEHLRAEFRCEVLHGLLTAAERDAAVAAFTRGPARVLLATDAAAEGLNLHARCRVAVLADLPWTPARLEQRIGRVDRLGQARRVHVWLLGAATAEGERLASRLGERAKTALTWIDAAAPDDHAGTRPSIRTREGEEDVEAWRHLTRARAFAAAACRGARTPGEPTGHVRATDTPVLGLLHPRRRRALGVPPGHALVVARGLLVADGERPLERTLVALAVRVAPTGRARDARRGDAPVESVCEAATAVARAHLQHRHASLLASWRAASAATAVADAAVAGAMREAVTAHFAQPGLFDTAETRAGRAPSDAPPPATPPDVSLLVTTVLVAWPRERR